jgi:hypothetical protein
MYRYLDTVPVVGNGTYKANFESKSAAEINFMDNRSESRNTDSRVSYIEIEEKKFRR